MLILDERRRGAPRLARLMSIPPHGGRPCVARSGRLAPRGRSFRSTTSIAFLVTTLASWAILSVATPYAHASTAGCCQHACAQTTLATCTQLSRPAQVRQCRHRAVRLCRKYAQRFPRAARCDAIGAYCLPPSTTTTTIAPSTTTSNTTTSTTTALATSTTSSTSMVTSTSTTTPIDITGTWRYENILASNATAIFTFQQAEPIDLSDPNHHFSVAVTGTLQNVALPGGAPNFPIIAGFVNDGRQVNLSAQMPPPPVPPGMCTDSLQLIATVSLDGTMLDGPAYLDESFCCPPAGYGCNQSRTEGFAVRVQP